MEAALACARLGAAAIGCVFFPKSPRNLSDAQAHEICRQLPPDIQKVGVFVNEGYDGIMRKVDRCALTAVQLHGRESPELVDALRANHILVIKALFAESEPMFSEAYKYHASAFLVECGKGVLPGGTALAWDWQQARSVSQKHPVILAGGLSPDNVSQAIAAGLPAAVDVSSGVEKAPGVKYLSKVKAFGEMVSRCTFKTGFPKIF